MIDRLAKIPLPWGEGIKERGMQVIILKMVIILTLSLSYPRRQNCGIFDKRKRWFCALLMQASKLFHVNRLPTFSSERVHYKNGQGAKGQIHIRVRGGFHLRAMPPKV
jgi:hypothetical protein